MTILNPSHWVEPYNKKSGGKYDKIAEMIAQINTNLSGIATNLSNIADKLHANESSYVHKISASLAWSGDDQAANLRSGTWLRSAGTGAVNLFFQIHPPEWLAKYAEDNSLTLKVTNVDVWWANNVSADYWERIRIWAKGFDISYTTSIIDDGTNYRQGSTTVGEKLTFNVTDTTMVRGDWIFLLIEFSQGTAESCRLASFLTTWTLT